MKASMKKPALGWNSFDCYGIFANERVLLENLNAFEKKLKPYGYEYFVLDAGWYSHFPLEKDGEFPLSKRSTDNEIDAFGRVIPNPEIFPRGVKHIADECHARGIKFGIHIMRGIPRKAVQLNTEIKGTSLRAQDIADARDTCIWNEVMYGVDMSRPGAQEYYDSVVELLASYGVDFIKADDITSFPSEIDGVARAIEKLDREIAYSLSPGNFVSPVNIESYRQANMLRVTCDIWDETEHLGVALDRWKNWEGLNSEDFWIDLDMIPFGALQVYSEENVSSEDEALLAGKGSRRMCRLSPDEKRTFITMRALAASPLFMGGELTQSDQESFDLITHPEVLACNQNGISGKQVFFQHFIDIRKTSEKDNPSKGWIGVFNRRHLTHPMRYTHQDLGLEKDRYPALRDIWSGEKLDFSNNEITLAIPRNGVVFLRYE